MRVRGRLFPSEAAIVLMPEAAMHEDDLLQPGEHKIRSSGKIGAVEAEPVAHRVRKPPNGELGLGVLLSDSPHVFADVHEPGSLMALGRHTSMAVRFNKPASEGPARAVHQARLKFAKFVHPGCKKDWNAQPEGRCFLSGDRSGEAHGHT